MRRVIAGVLGFALVALVACHRASAPPPAPPAPTAPAADATGAADSGASQALAPAPSAASPPRCIVAETPPRVAAYEVTLRDYRKCVTAKACSVPAAGVPAHWPPRFRAAMRDEGRSVTGVTREQAAAYCAWIGSRLPTSDEWTRAARADCRKFPWGDDWLGGRSNCLHNEAGRPIARPGAYPDDVVRGVYDLQANVSEWTSDGPPLGAPYCDAPLGTPLESASGDESVGFRCMAAERPAKSSRVGLDASVDAEPPVLTDDAREQGRAEKMAREGKRGCAGQTRLIDAHGEVTSCYPYRCRAGACLTRCKTRDDCVPSANPGESVVVKGWPILCGGHTPPGPNETAECLPLSPEEVHGRR